MGTSSASQGAVEALQQQLRSILQELHEQRRAGDVAEVMGVVLHELGNVVNNMVLEAGLLQRQLAPGDGARLEELQRLGHSVSGYLGPLARYRQRCRAKAYPVDLNEAVRNLLNGMEQGRADLQGELTPDRLPVLATAADLERAVRLLLGGIRAAHGSRPAALLIKTGRDAGKVCLRIEGATPLQEPEFLNRLFEPFASFGEEDRPLERAAARALVRRLQGTLRVTSGESGGVQVVVQFPECAEP